MQRALIEIYYAMAEFRLSGANARHKLDATGARLVVIMAQLEELILVREQEPESERAA
ncbi:hypothetical protein M2323_004267 [Rhodoblastus acidophilus]|uniref:hypothetical protein n=1 Tax=Rhodoblastus acidophilus TaxID=1074 RepID=UPI002224AC7B|nr:hypothetical protein [Rhodoblastus acidophilus]MCW2286492.1 hypothetical protein [Rhodoblastus acidophilus]MCW2335320.1 hypothetical protein [Rhodoblastus acidophilus]